MNSIKYNTRNRSKPVPDLINYFSSSEDDLVDDVDVNFVRTSNHKPIFGMRPRKRIRKSIVERNLNEFASSTPARRTGNFKAPSISPIETGESDSILFSNSHRNSVFLQMQEITSTANSFRKRNSRRGNETRKQVDSKNSKNADNDYGLVRSSLRTSVPADRTKEMPETNTKASSPLNNANDARRDTLAIHVQTSFLTSTGISPKVKNVLTQTTVDRGTQITHSLENSKVDSESDNSEKGRRKNVLVDKSVNDALRRTRRSTEMSLTICAHPSPRVNNREAEHDSVAGVLREDGPGQVNYGKIDDDWVAELLSQHLKNNISASSSTVDKNEVERTGYLDKELAVEVEQLNVENIGMPLNRTEIQQPSKIRRSSNRKIEPANDNKQKNNTNISNRIITSDKDILKRCKNNLTFRDEKLNNCNKSPVEGDAVKFGKLQTTLRQDDVRTMEIEGVNNLRKKINIIEDRILADTDTVASDSLLNKENIQPVKGKKSSKRYKKLITAESTDDLSQGLRRSKRQRKERVIDYPATIVIARKRLFECLTKDNHAFRARGLAEASQQQLESYYKTNKSNVTGRNASKAMSPKKTKLGKTSRETKNSRRESSIKNTITEAIEELSKKNSPKKTKLTKASRETKLTRNNKRENPIENTITEEIEQSLPNSEAISQDIQPTCISSNVNVPQRNSSSREEISTHHQSRPYFYFPQDNKVCKIDYFSANLCFNAISENESIRMAVGLKSSRAGFQSGMLEIQPGQCKPKDMTVKFALTFFVFEGKGVFYVHDSYSVVQPPNMLYVPLGAYYSISNQSHTERLRLYYVKIKPHES